MEQLVEIGLENFEITFNESNNRHTSKSEYDKSFESLHESLEKNDLQKVVLSKIKEVDCSKNPEAIFNDLNQNYASTFNYLLSSPAVGCWLGATPELLLESDGLKVNTVSLAGTVLQDESWSDKELEEQQYVTDYIVNTLTENGFHTNEVSGPVDCINGIVKHLKTTITADYTNRASFTQTLQALHPTPATCGIPTIKAKELILSTENHDRKLYTGFILLNFNQPKAFVNLRCLELLNNKAHLFLGGGLTQKSDCEKEWQETERKAETLLKVLK